MVKWNLNNQIKTFDNQIKTQQFKHISLINLESLKYKEVKKIHTNINTFIYTYIQKLGLFMDQSLLW